MNDTPPLLPESRLIRASLAGDRMAFGELVRRYQDRLFSSLIHVLGNDHDAQEIAQDAFVQAYRKLDSFRGESAFYTWLFRIARNLAISRIRSRHPVSSLSFSAGGERELSGDSPAPGDSLESQEAVEQVRRAMTRLPEEQRTILILREFENLDYDAISNILEIPVGTVRSRLHRARAQLKEELIALGLTHE